MTIDTRRVAHALLLAAGLCGCAGQHHRPATVSDESLSQAQPSDGSDGVQSTQEVADDANQDEPVANDSKTIAGTPREVRHAPKPDAQDATNDSNHETNARDNTAANERDRGGETLTPGDQGNNESDLETTRRIRETVVDDDSLSFAAKNVKIITVNGRVTLRGPVGSEAERTTIEKKALAVAGAGQVVNQLEIK